MIKYILILSVAMTAPPESSSMSKNFFLSSYSVRKYWKFYSSSHYGDDNQYLGWIDLVYCLFGKQDFISTAYQEPHSYLFLHDKHITCGEFFTLTFRSKGRISRVGRTLLANDYVSSGSSLNLSVGTIAYCLSFFPTVVYLAQFPIIILKTINILIDGYNHYKNSDIFNLHQLFFFLFLRYFVHAVNFILIDILHGVWAE